MKIYKLTNILNKKFIAYIYCLTGKPKDFPLNNISSIYILCQQDFVVFLVNCTNVYGVVKPSSKHILELILSSKEMHQASYKKITQPEGSLSRYYFRNSKHSIEYLCSIVESIKWFDFEQRKSICI